MTNESLFQIQSQLSPDWVKLPNAKNFYEIDLNTRKVESPEVLSLSKDHKSNVIYFRMDRYFDYMDLAETTGIIEYIPAGSKDRIPYVYVIPFYDTGTDKENGKIIFPWVIDGAAAANSGIIEYGIRFYKVKELEDGSIQLIYNLNLSPAKSRIEKSLDVNTNGFDDAYNEIIADKYEHLIQQLSNQATMWTILD